MKFTRWSPISKRNHTLELDVTEAEYAAFQGGAGTYRATMPRISSDEYYWLHGGVTPDEQVAERAARAIEQSARKEFIRQVRGTEGKTFQIEICMSRMFDGGLSVRCGYVLGLPSCEYLMELSDELAGEDRMSRDCYLLLDCYRQDGQSLEDALLRELDKALYDELQENDAIRDDDEFICTVGGRVYRWGVYGNFHMARKVSVEQDIQTPVEGV